MAVTDTPARTPEQIVERNLKVVEEHVHNENPVDIDKAIAVYGDTGRRERVHPGDHADTASSELASIIARSIESESFSTGTQRTTTGTSSSRLAISCD